MRIETIGDATLYCADCRDVLPMLSGVDAVVTDPPYGIGIAKRGTLGTKRLAPVRDYGKSDWDNETPPPEVISSLLSCSTYQIIFGGNFFHLPPSSCWLVWDKETSGDYADCELAWTNLPKAVRRIKFMWNGMLRAHGEPRGDHPTQKPVGVMQWCLGHLPDEVSTVLDPFMGSGTTGVACARTGHKFVGIERETKYFDASCRRIAEAQKNRDLFVHAAPQPKPETPDMFA